MRNVLIAISVLIAFPADATWGPDSPAYRHEAPIIGTWKGEFQGKIFEIAIWPDSTSHKLTGAMVWGECRAVLGLSGIDLHGAIAGATKEKFDATPNLDRYLFGMASYPNQVNMPGNRCPGEGRPGYGGFHLNTDESFSLLTMYSYATYPALKKHPGTLQRSVPSRKLAEVVRWLDTKTSVTLTTMAENVVFDPTLNYFQLSEKQFATRLDDIDGLSFVSDFGFVYRIDRTQSKHPDRQYFKLVVVDDELSTFSVGDIGGEGYFAPTSQEMLITLYGNAPPCGVTHYPYTIFDVSQQRDATPTAESAEGQSWVLNSPKGSCKAVSLNSYCRNVTCTDWLDTQDKPVVSSSR